MHVIRIFFSQIRYLLKEIALMRFIFIVMKLLPEKIIMSH